jgi:esterase/lipase superfamily enzyme
LHTWPIARANTFFPLAVIRAATQSCPTVQKFLDNPSSVCNHNRAVKIVTRIFYRLSSGAPKKGLALLFSVGVLGLLQGCSTTYTSKDALVRVFYATDRNHVSDSGPVKYGAERDKMSYGACYVDIPRDRHMGAFESEAIWSLKVNPDDRLDVEVMKILPAERTNFFSSLRSTIKSSRDQNAFLFVHGYNTTFEDAARRTAQMAYDLGFNGAPVFYSWPSRGTVTGYFVDGQNVEWAESDLQNFLDDFANRTDAKNVYLIAHSMGSRALTRALAAVLAENPNARQKFRELILAAPDIDADVFKNEIAGQLISTNLLITLYASSRDRALIAARELQGGYPRLGEAGASLVILPGMDTIDASAVDTSLIGHSYYAEDRSILSDIFYLIRDATPLGQRPRACLEEVNNPLGQYWEFKP